MKYDKSNASGNWVLVNGNNVFNPNPLPPQIVWDQELVSMLSRADILIGRLAGEGRRLPNPHLFIRPFIKKEAIFSSKIEGTQATLGDLFLAETTIDRSKYSDDLNEVANYVKALENGLNLLKKIPISLRLVLELHKQLMLEVRGNTATPGKFRTIQNWIGKPGCQIIDAAYVPPDPLSIPQHLSLWEKFINESQLPALVQAALMHYQFEAIHPFIDGNGRVGRLLITLFLCEKGILTEPLLYLSAFFDATRSDYYSYLRNVSLQSDWKGWLLYFLKGVIVQSEDALLRAESINNLLASWRNLVVNEGNKYAFQLIDLIAVNPFITVPQAQQLLNTAYNTAAKAVLYLTNKGIISYIEDSKRERLYCAKELLKILEAPSRLFDF